MENVIVLTKSFQYHREAPLRTVLKWIAKNKIEIVLEHAEREIVGVQIRIRAPLVVRLLDFVGYKIKRDTDKYSPGAVYDRDNNTCQYWHKDARGKKYKHTCTVGERSIDHVIPQDKEGEDSFENRVCSCKTHNAEKGNKPLSETGFELIRVPRAPRNRRGEMAVFKFAFDPEKVSHVYYFEKFLGKVL